MKLVYQKHNYVAHATYYEAWIDVADKDDKMYRRPFYFWSRKKPTDVAFTKWANEKIQKAEYDILNPEEPEEEQAITVLKEKGIVKADYVGTLDELAKNNIIAEKAIL